MSPRDKYLRTNYAMTEAEWLLILEVQGGGCASCGREGVTRSLHTDHDHKTGLVRGILCAACNSGLKKYRDNPEFLQRAAAYLLDPPAARVVGERVAKTRPRRRRRKAVKRKREQRAVRALKKSRNVKTKHGD